MRHALFSSDLILPWTSDLEEDRRFWWLLLSGVVLFVVLSVVVTTMSLPELKQEELEALPPQLARIVLEKKTLPPPKVEEPKPRPVKEPEPVEPRKSDKVVPPTPGKALQQAREKALGSGLLQFRDELAAMRDAVQLDQMDTGELSRSRGEAARVDRSLISKRAAGTSGGVSTAALSRNTGGAALGGRETTRVSSQAATAEYRQSSDQAAGGGRSDEAIRKVMERQKGGIYAIYNRALRQDPSLQGKVTVRLVIEPSGAVSSVKLLSSELGDQALEKKLLARIRMIDFGAEDVARTTLNYVFDFLPY